MPLLWALSCAVSAGAGVGGVRLTDAFFDWLERRREGRRQDEVDAVIAVMENQFCDYDDSEELS